MTGARSLNFDRDDKRFCVIKALRDRSPFRLAQGERDGALAQRDGVPHYLREEGEEGTDEGLTSALVVGRRAALVLFLGWVVAAAGAGGIAGSAWEVGVRPATAAALTSAAALATAFASLVEGSKCAHDSLLFGHRCEN